MSKKIYFGAWLAGMFLLLIVGAIPARAVDTYICTCVWTETEKTQNITAYSSEDCTSKCGKVGATAMWYPAPEGELPTQTIGSQPSIQTPSPSVRLDNPLGSITSPQVLIGQVINSVLGIVGSLALLMFVFGGLTWMTSSGNQEKVKKGRDIIVWSAIGLAVIFMAYALTRFVLSTIVQ